jgi:hypothetical protein
VKLPRVPDTRSIPLSRRQLTVAVVIVALLGGGLWLAFATRGERAQTGPPGAAPSGAQPAPGTVNWEGWKLTLPVEGKKGNAAIVEPAALTPPWLTANADGSLTFWAPAEGATTENSDHPRTELNSLNNFSAATSGPHTLKASLAVNQVPEDSQSIIIAQIHGADDISSVPYVMLHYRDGDLRVVVKQKHKGSDLQSYPLLTGVPLNERFDIAISDIGNGQMTFSATYNGQTKQASSPVPDTFHDETVRFQVGDYQQADDSKGPNDGGKVTFYQISELSTAP